MHSGSSSVETVLVVGGVVFTMMKIAVFLSQSGNSTLYILRAAAALRPGGPFGQIFGVRPPQSDQTDDDQLQDVKKYHAA